ncbi:MAG: TIGR03032 family protein [Pseudomonadota bacterium]
MTDNASEDAQPGPKSPEAGQTDMGYGQAGPVGEDAAPPVPGASSDVTAPGGEAVTAGGGWSAEEPPVTDATSATPAATQAATQAATPAAAQAATQAPTPAAPAALAPGTARPAAPAQARPGAPAQQGGQKQGQPQKTEITCSGGLAAWLGRMKCSLAFTSYQSGQLFLVGHAPNGQVTFHQHGFGRAMGVWADPTRLYMATSSQIWRMENALRPGQVANQRFDRLYVPRNAQTVGPVDIHEIGVEPSGRIIFVNTQHSCLATVSVVHGFRPIWKPPFISRLAAEDRCHLNGLGMENGRARYVSAVCRSDVIAGWRERRGQGGLVVDLADDDRILTEGLSMPHSPRVWNGQLYVLNSGRGELARVDRQTGAQEVVAFMPGFLRGLTFVNNFAIATLSLPRDKSFAGLELDQELERRDADPWCGIQVIDLNSGDVVHWVRLKGGPIRELFDVTVLPGVRTPMAAGSMAGQDAHVTWEEEFGPLYREPAQ